MLQEEGEVNRFEEPLRPFSHPLSHGHTRPAICEDSFDTAALGYNYDRVPQRPPQRLRERPTYALFKGIDLLRIGLHSYVVQVYLQASTPGAPEVYAGSGAIFGGKGSECVNCRKGGSVNLLVDVTRALRGCGVSRDEVSVRVQCEDEFGTVHSLQQLQQRSPSPVPIPSPTLVGPFFEDGESPLKTKTDRSFGDIMRLQQYLTKHGYLQSNSSETSHGYDAGDE
jgi:hypothetical protein